MTELKIEPYHIPGVRLGTENPLPIFRNSEPDKCRNGVVFDPALPAEKRNLVGWQTGGRTLPYRMQDRYTRNKEPLAFKSAACRALLNQPPEHILHTASGWGALEMRRRGTDPGAPPLPASFVFPESTIGIEQKKWIHLLEKGRLPEQEPSDEPGEWMIQDEWRELLEKSIGKNDHWFALLHAGVMRIERFDEAGAQRAWEESIRRKPSAWAYRNLAALAIRQKRNADALRDYETAWGLAAGSSSIQTALAGEYLQALSDSGEYGKASRVYTELPLAVQEFDRIQIVRGKIALSLGELDVVEAVLRREYAVIQEGEIALTDLWFGMWEKRLAAQTERAIDDDLKADVRRLHPPPAGIDFRMK